MKFIVISSCGQRSGYGKTNILVISCNTAYNARYLNVIESSLKREKNFFIPKGRLMTEILLDSNGLYYDWYDEMMFATQGVWNFESVIFLS